MSRHGYSDDLDQQDLAMWRGRVSSAIRGKRGQKMLAELAAALDAMPTKRLIARSLQKHDGDVCALGCLAKVKGKDFTEYDDEEYEDIGDELNGELAAAFDVAECLVQEVEYENDECGHYHDGKPETPEQRWERMRRWVARKIKEPAP